MLVLTFGAMILASLFKSLEAVIFNPAFIMCSLKVCMRTYFGNGNFESRYASHFLAWKFSSSKLGRALSQAVKRSKSFGFCDSKF